MKKGYVFGLFMAGLALVWSCSTKRATLVSRSYHSLTSRYNVLFNSRESLRKGVKELEDKATSDFYAELPLEGIEFDDKVYLPGQSKSPYIEKAEEKAAKAVQKHSMNIGGTEYNTQMDEAMLLLAQARYYDQRYLSALDALNYALDTYYDSNIRDKLLLWRAKVYLKLGNVEYARRALHRIIKNKKTNPDDKALAYAFLAESFRDEFKEELDTAAVLYRLAALNAQSKNLKMKLAYKSAQVWEKLGRKDSALAMTDLILKHNYPENFVLRTRWYRMHLTLEDTARHGEYLKKLNAYFKNYYFNKYYPEIHYRMGEIYDYRKENDSAVKHYTQAAHSSNKTLKKLAYSSMADIFWDRSDYLTAGKYLDSLLQVLDKNTLEHLLVAQKRRSIAKIMQWEEVIQQNDSILRFIQLDTATQRQKILAHIEKLKEQERKKKEKPQEEAEKTEGTFYFYNTAQVEKGREAFAEHWGDRKLEDLWFLKNKYGELDNEVIEEEEEAMVREQEERHREEKKVKPEYTVEYYLKRLPQNEKQIDSIRNLMLKAHLYLGINYADEKIKEYDLALKHLDTVMQAKPDAETEAQALYMLYKIHKKLHQTDKSRYYAEQLAGKYPDHYYTRFVLHPEENQHKSNEQFNEDLKKVYMLDQAGKWTEAKQLTEKLILQYREHPEAAKLYFYKAKLAGKTQGIDDYIKNLDEIARIFPDTEYQKQAEELARQLKMLKIKYGQSAKKEEPPYYLVFKQPADSVATEQLKQCLQEFYNETRSFTKRIFKVNFTEETPVIVTGNFLSRPSAEYIIEKLKEKKCQVPEYYIMSRNKFIHLHLTKNKDALTQKR